MRAYRIAYDGRPYSGFQRQPDVPTVEGTLFAALEKHGVLDPDAHRPAGYAAAGRTDAGVSAVAQTVAFDAPDWLTPRAFNGRLPGSIRAWAAADVADGFHATHDAARRTYRYYLFAPATDGAPDAVGPHVDVDLAAAALDRLSGRHDFADLTPDGAGTERDLSASATREGDFLVIEASAGGFPRAFVRRLVTLVRAVGTGNADLAFVDRVLDPEPLPDHEAVGAAPPEPLVLWDVSYPDAGFAIDPEAVASARIAFGERYATARVAGAVTSAIRGRIGPKPGAEPDLEG